jgi:hypothetical protein
MPYVSQKHRKSKQLEAFVKPIELRRQRIRFAPKPLRRGRIGPFAWQQGK